VAENIENIQSNEAPAKKADSTTKKELLEQVKALTEAVTKQEEEISALKTEALEYKDKWYRSVAEFENFKKRNAETRKNAFEEGKTDAITKILFIGDNLDRALAYSIDNKTKEGLEMLLKQYGEVMSNLGLEVINPVGENFDPNLHEAIFIKDAEEGQETGIVDSVFLKGYKLGNKIIRYAQVVVTK